MSLPSDAERRRLDEVAFDLREIFVERGHRVDAALEVDPAFGSGQSRSSLTRDLAMDAINRATSRVGDLYFQPVNGSGREIIGSEHRYRVRRARRDSEGELIITASNESSLGYEEELSLFPRALWVFGWIVDSDGLIAEIFIAEVLGISAGRPGRVLLGPDFPLGGGDSFGGGGFTPSTEDDLDDEDDDGESEDHLRA